RQRVSQLVEDQRRLLGLALGHAATPSRSTGGVTCKKPPTLLSASTVSSSGRRVRSAAGMPVASETLGSDSPAFAIAAPMLAAIWFEVLLSISTHYLSISTHTSPYETISVEFDR